MSKMSTKMFIFAAGAIIGSAVAWLYAKKHYEKIVDDEIESMKEWLDRRVEEQDKKVDESKKPDEKATADLSADEYGDKLEALGYVNYSKREENKKTNEEVSVVDEPYVIKPEIFGEEGYDEVSLTYYADGVLADEQDCLVEDIANTVGEDYADYFGVYEEDSVFVRNDRLKIDFEILADVRKYSDLYKED